MRHLAVYMMLVLGGNASPSAEDVTKALSSVGIEADEARLSQLIAEMEGKDLNEVMEAGKKKLASLGGGGGGGAPAAGGAAGGAAAEAVEEKKEEEEEEVDMGGGMDMFGGGEGGDY
ncbi:60s acidic ribosomal protein-domain-containing protein [Tribonema minus]|uniref:60s acidic ribosomal protein-domain-containing protein n=1 Tax=Tribonema minus TaxID=303371 RepID=A0A835ZFT3_9STRA|nr:60s acidic ribosomal protein-domain-containing protein [Tribonema minus]